MATLNSLPLIHFCDFLLQTLSVRTAARIYAQRDAAPVFNLLKDKYASELKRDPSFDKVDVRNETDLQMMTEIGEKYYNIRPQGNLLENMMRMFSGM